MRFSVTRALTLKGGERELSESFAAMQNELQSHLAGQQIKFVYNPPSVPHYGGAGRGKSARSKQPSLTAQTVTE